MRDIVGPRPAIASVDNALQVLLLLQSKDRIRVSDVARELGLGQSTAHRLLTTLEGRGFVIRERNSAAYRAGPSILEFGFSHANIKQVREVARPWLVSLSRQMNETANLMTMEDDGVRFLDSAECVQPVRVPGRTATLLPAHATAGGKVLLAGLSDAGIRDRLDRDFRRVTGATLRKRSALQDELHEVRRLGYGVNLGESLDGLHAVAVPVRDLSGHVIASLAFSVPATRGGLFRLRSLVAPLREASTALGEVLELHPYFADATNRTGA